MLLPLLLSRVLPTLGYMAPSTGVTIAATAVTTTALIALVRWALYPHRERSIASPLRILLPNLAPDQSAQLDYAPDAFPGARDVDTPVRFRSSAIAAA